MLHDTNGCIWFQALVVRYLGYLKEDSIKDAWNTFKSEFEGLGLDPQLYKQAFDEAVARASHDVELGKVS
jgi:hypothetical protein